MARLSVYFFQEDVSGNTTLNKNINPSAITLEKNGSPIGSTWTNNGDGTYYTNIASSGLYTVKLNGAEQDEFKNIYIAAEDSITTGSLDSDVLFINGSGDLSFVSKSILLSTKDIINNLTSTSTVDALSAAQGKYIQDNFLEISDIVNDLTTGGASVPLSAEMGKTLNSQSLQLSDIVQSISTGGTNKVVSATAIKDAVELNFAVETLLDDDKTISQNFELLQNAYTSLLNINNVAETVTSLYVGPSLATSGSQNLSNDDNEATYQHWTTTNTSFQHKFRTNFIKAHNMKTMVAMIEPAPFVAPGKSGQIKLQCEEAESGVTVFRNTANILDTATQQILTCALTNFVDGDVVSCDLYIRKVSGSGAFGVHNRYMRVWASSTQENVLRTKYGLVSGSSGILPVTASEN